MNAERREKLEAFSQGFRERWMSFEDSVEGAGGVATNYWRWLSARPGVQRWLVVVVGIAGATLLGLMFQPYMTVGSQLMLFLPAVMLATLYGNSLTGLGTALLGASASFYFYFRTIDPGFQQAIGSNDFALLGRQNYISLVLYAVSCFMVVGLVRAQAYHQRKANLLAETLEQRVAERSSDAQAAHAELAGFCYSISHDLRAPMRNIIGSSRILQEESTSLGAAEIARLDSMAASAQRLSNLVDDLLGHARLSEAEIKPEWIDLSRLCEETCEWLAKQPWPCTDCRWRIPPGLVVGADPILILLVMRSLLENAFKYSKPGEVLRIEVGEARRRSRTWFYVKDNGIGLDMQFAPKIFEAFQKLHRDSEVGGTGIGLANVKRIVERHGGEIFVESTLGTGSTFYFNFGGQVPTGPRPTSNVVEPKKVILADEG